MKSLEKYNPYNFLIHTEMLLLKEHLTFLDERMDEEMERSTAFWKVFEVTGHIGAYLLYKDYKLTESETAVQKFNEEKVMQN